MNEVDTENLLSESSVEWAAHAVCSFVSSAVPTIVFLCSCFFFLVEHPSAITDVVSAAYHLKFRV